MIKKALVALALSGAFASAQADVLLQEGFNSIGTLGGSGWVFNNQSTPGGITSWFQGDQGNFGAYEGAPEGYIAANYDNAPVGGTINNWLISPEFANDSNVVVTLWLRGAYYDGYFDQLQFGFSGGGSDTADFTMGTPVVAPTDAWTEFTFNFSAHGAGSMGRFAINYNMPADLANYFGIDALRIETATTPPPPTDLPEPASALIVATGLAALGAARRRSRS